MQEVCSGAQFKANRVVCSAACDVGIATVQTPVLPVPLTGPVYFVSYGGEAFPDLVMVLQGEGVTIELVGNTFIKKGVTSATFERVPDAPVSSFEVTLPEGRYSALAANGNLCGQKLAMPTFFTAQNGATLNQNTHIQVTGCPKAKKHKHHKAKKHHKGRHGKK